MLSTVRRAVELEMRRKIQRALADGCRTSGEVARRIGVSPTTAWRYLKRLGYRPNSRGWSPSVRRRKGNAN